MRSRPRFFTSACCATTLITRKACTAWGCWPTRPETTTGPSALVERAAALSPAVGRYHYHLGLALAAVQRYEAAEQAFARAHDLDPDWSDARANRERVRRRLER